MTSLMRLSLGGMILTQILYFYDGLGADYILLLFVSIHMAEHDVAKRAIKKLKRENESLESGGSDPTRPQDER